MPESCGQGIPAELRCYGLSLELPADLRAHYEAMPNRPERLSDLLAEYLCAAVERRLRTCLGREFQQTTVVANRVRGHVDVLRTARLGLLQRGKIACRVENLTADTPLNRCVRTALRLLQGLSRGRTAQLCSRYASAMERAGVLGPCPPEREMCMLKVRQARVRTPGSLKDRHMLDAAWLVFRLVRMGGGRPVPLEYPFI